MDRGELVPDELVVAVVEERFANPREVEHGFVLDGFPRTSQQALELDRILGDHPLDVVIDLDVPTEVVVERMRARGREDDTDESIRRRLALYDSETKPLVDFYRERSLLATIDGLGTEDDVADAMRRRDLRPLRRFVTLAQVAGPDPHDAPGRARRRRDARGVRASGAARRDHGRARPRRPGTCWPGAVRGRTSSATTGSPA